MFFTNWVRSGYALDLLEAGRRLLATNTVNWKGTRYLNVFEIFQKDQKQLEASLFREKPDGNGPGNIVKRKKSPSGCSGSTFGGRS